MIFVFGSNRAGVHGAGAALTAKQRYGARQGVGEGLCGQSYAIPTKAAPYAPLPHGLADVRLGVLRFLLFARAHPELAFQVTRIGCGRAGYAESDIRPLFADAPKNCRLPEGWRPADGTPSDRGTSSPTGSR